MSTSTKTATVNVEEVRKEMATLAELAKLPLGEHAQEALCARLQLLKGAIAPEDSVKKGGVKN